ncbi:MAG: cysteine desulfurase family protein [Acidimicrobiales bacterium]
MAHYLDHSATTPPRPVAIGVMTRLLTGQPGNPSGAHRFARDANRVLDDARETMAEFLACDAGEIVFTAGGTEADNLAVLGVLDAQGGRALCSAIEHHAVLEPVEHRKGLVCPVRADGRIDLVVLQELLATAASAAADDDSLAISLVSVMTVNNETGIVQPMAEVARIVRELAPDAVLHTDAVQAFSWIDLRTVAPHVDLLSLAAHKFGGPQGVGVLMVRRGTPLAARTIGGGQERERRSGTQNVAGIAAMVAAAAEADTTRTEMVARTRAMRDRLVSALVADVPGTHVSGVVDGVEPERVAGIAHLCFDDIESEALLFLLEKHDIFASAASSCASGAMEPSHVLAAMGLGRDLAFGSLRLSLGYTTNDDDINAAIAAIGPAVARLRERS